MTQTPERKPARSANKSSGVDAAARNLQKLNTEMAQTWADLSAARLLEGAAKRRNEREKLPETEAAYEGRRGEADRLRRRYARLVEDLGRQGGARPRQG